MSFDERLSWFLLGVLVGLLISWLKDIRNKEDQIQKKLEEVDEHVKQKRVRDEAGFMRFPLVADILVLSVVLMTAYAAFVSQKAANESDDNNKQVAAVVQRLDVTQVALEDAQRELKAVSSCNTIYQQRTIRALNERTQYSADQALANVRLQQAQAAFLQIVLVLPPVAPSVSRAALEKYYGNLATFVEISQKNRQQILKYAYPTNEELSSCITKAIENAKKAAEKKAEEKPDDE